MASRSVSFFFNTLLSLSLVVSMALVSRRVQAQDYTEEEYQQYQAVDAETDPVKKTDMTVSFIKGNPKSSLRAHLIASFQRLIAELSQEQKWSQVIAIGDKFLTVEPSDKITIDALTYAYSSTKNLKGITTFGEKTYASSPSEALAYSLAIAYLELGNDAKFIQWGDKIPSTSPNYAVILPHLMRKTSGAKQQQYAKACISIFPTTKKPEGMDDKAWNDTVNSSYAAAYGVLGGAAYENRSYGPAITHLTNALKYNKANETAYYFLGLSYWRTNKLDFAMLNFAKAYLFKGSTSANAKKYLEEIWASSHQGSTTGVDRVIQKAQQDLK
jgi:tetratricopeptide (TPR) repeat protein